jgi:hypothetical protein
LAWTCCALVAPNSTLVTAGLASGNAIASARRIKRPRHGGILDPGPLHQAVGQLNRAGRHHAKPGRRPYCLPGQVSGPVHQAPRAGFPGADEPGLR